MFYEQTDLIREPRAEEPRRLDFEIPDDARADGPDDDGGALHPAWGFSLHLEDSGNIELRRSDARGFWIPLLLTKQGAEYFAALEDPDGESVEALAERLVAPLMEFSPETPPVHVGPAAREAVARWFARVRADLALARTPVGHFVWPRFALTLEPRGEGSQSHPTLTLASHYRSGVLTMALAGRSSVAPDGDWAPLVLDREGRDAHSLAERMLYPLLAGVEIEPETLVQEITESLRYWLELNRYNSRRS